MAQWFDGKVPVRGVTIHYTRTGGQKPPVVLLHGVTDNGLCWTRVAKVLEQDYDVVMVDERGHGLSSWSEENLSDDFQAADVAALIDTLKLGKPFVIGHSMGASTASLLAANYPDHVRAIVLEDPSWRAAPLPMPSVIPWLTDLKTHTREELIEIARRDYPTWDEEDLGPWADAKLQANLARFSAQTLARRPWQEIIQKITCPTLLITGDPERGATVTAEIAQQAVDLLPDGRFVHLGGAGHSIRREQFLPFIEVVSNFLKEH